MNLDAIVRDLAAAEGIPPALIPSVVHRANMARRAVVQWTRYDVLGEGVRTLARRVVARSVKDHAAGVLERRVGEVG